MAVRAATMAGEPKPCVMRLKWVRFLWIEGSSICCGRVLHSGDRSWFSRSMSSLVITLQEEVTKCQFLEWGLGSASRGANNDLTLTPIFPSETSGKPT